MVNTLASQGFNHRKVCKLQSSALTKKNEIDIGFNHRKVCKLQWLTSFQKIMTELFQSPKGVQAAIRGTFIGASTSTFQSPKGVQAAMASDGINIMTQKMFQSPKGVQAAMLHSCGCFRWLLVSITERCASCNH